MTDHIPGKQNTAFDCVDTALGDLLWRLDDPECPQELRTRLDVHVTHCADCRLRRAVQRGVAEGLRSGDLDASPARVRRWVPWTGGLAAAALAAGLALLVVLPPTAPHEQLTLRGEDGPVIERPVADEVVLDRNPTVRWSPMDGATRYHVLVESVDGAYRWETSTDAPRTDVPADRSLPADTRFRVRVAPVPAHLAPDGAMLSSFRTGGVAAWLDHRLRYGADAGRALGGLGLAALVTGLLGLVPWRRGS